MASGDLAALPCCHAGCSNAGNLRCGKCKVARYCGAACQRADWRAGHKAVCPLHALNQMFGGDGAVPYAVPNGGGLNPSGLLSATCGSWYDGLSRERVYERLWMSFQLRVEDEYVFAGELCGTYNTQAMGGPKSQTTNEFRRYVQLYKEKGMLPPDWSPEDGKQLMKGAQKNIHHALQKEDVVERFGYGNLEHMQLRMMAEEVLGPIGNWDLS